MNFLTIRDLRIRHGHANIGRLVPEIIAGQYAKFVCLAARAQAAATPKPWTKSSKSQVDECAMSIL